MSETTSEQLAEIERDMADIERQVAELEQEAAKADYKTQELPDKTQELETKTQELPAEYTPPEGWRVLQVGEALREGDVIVHKHDAMYATARAGGWVGAKQRYIRRIEPQPQQVQVPEPDAELQIRLLKQANDSQAETIGRLQAAIDERAELGVADQIRVEMQGRIRELEAIRDYQAAAIEELRSEVSYVQNLLGTERRRVTQLEDLVGSLRTINEAQEKAFNAAGKANTDLQHRLNVVAAEWAEQAETIRRLQIELDAAQQVPQAIADRFEEGWNQGTARAVETVLEWLEPIRAVDNEHLANEALQHLPQIMRHLTGLAQD